MFLNRKTILYFISHPREELEIMGADIRCNLSRGHKVHVILCTFDGADTTQTTPLETAFRKSCQALGVKDLNIHLPKSREKTGSLTVSYAERLIKNHLILWDRSGIVCTPSQNQGQNQHPDSKALGKAAENQLKRGLIGELRLFVEPALYETVCQNPYLIPVEPYESRAKDETKLGKAMENYPRGNSSQDGFCSRYYVLHNPKTETKRQKLQFQQQKWKKLMKQELVCFSSGKGEAPVLGAWKLVSVLAGQTEEYREFCENYQVAFNEKNLQRIADGASFWCLVSEAGEVAASCWMAYRQPFYMGETDLGFHMGESNTGLLFALATAPKFRDMELEPLLLKAIVNQAREPERFLMYTSADNKATQEGIRKAGFACDGALSVAKESLPNYLRGEGFVDLYHKYQNEGKTVNP